MGNAVVKILIVVLPLIAQTLLAVTKLRAIKSKM